MVESAKTFTAGVLLSPRQAAVALGVSESSVKRWCDRGQLRAVRTSGGHRRIAADELARFARASGQALRASAVGARGGAPPRRALASLQRDLSRALLGDDADRVREVLQAACVGRALDEVADHVIAPVMADVGRRWAEGALEIYVERRACELVHRALRDLGDRLGPSPIGAPKAIGGTLEGDPFSIPTALAELVLRERGFDARSLGAWLPAETLARAALQRRPRIVWLSVSQVRDPRRLAGEVATVEREAARVGAALVVGGRALAPEVRRSLRYTVFCDGMTNLGAFADSLARVVA